MSKAIEKKSEVKTFSKNQETPKLGYSSDIVTQSCNLGLLAGAARDTDDHSVVCNAFAEGVITYFYIDNKIDIARNIYIRIAWERDDGNLGTLPMILNVQTWPSDGGAGNSVIANEDHTLPARQAGRYGVTEITLDENDVSLGDVIDVQFTCKNTWPGAGYILKIKDITFKYYILRSLS